MRVDIKVVSTEGDERKYQAAAHQGVQHFLIGYAGTQEEAEFMARMFRKALRASQREYAKRYHREHYFDVRP